MVPAGGLAPDNPGNPQNRLRRTYPYLAKFRWFEINLDLVREARSVSYCECESYACSEV
jgi:hypothetical protein